MNAPALSVRDLTVRYGRAGKTPPAVDGVSFDVAPGETLGLVGESGSGKSTIGKAVLGLQPPAAGQVLLHGADITRASLRQRRVTAIDLRVVFQDPYSSLNPAQTIGQTLTEPLQVLRVPKDQRQPRILESLAAVGLPADAADRYPARFSGGQRQRIAIARALVCEPKVIVLDEPVSALDVSIRAQVLNLMKRLQADHGLTYIVISHDLAVVKYMADRIGVMYLGKLVEMGTADDIYQRAAHPYTAGLIATIPVPDPKEAKARKDAGIKGELPSPVNPPSGCRFRTRCPIAQDLCAEQEPPLRSFGPGHIAACHFALQS